jgi:hypothetical protein
MDLFPENAIQVLHHDDHRLRQERYAGGVHVPRLLLLLLLLLLPPC